MHLRTDGLGSTTQLVDSSGSVTDTYTYDVFGALRSTSGSTTNPVGFAGQQTDHTANRGLQYLRARHYDPALGRFLGRDPAPSGNRYVYADDDPVNYQDPQGACRVTVSLRTGGSGGRSALQRFGRWVHGLYTRPRGESVFYHAYIVTADPITGEKNLAEGGPRGGHLFAGSGTFFGDSASSYRSDPRKTVYDDGGSCNTINADLRAAAEAITKLQFAYDPIYLNSNSAASELLETIGIIPQKPSGNAPGWGRNLMDALFIGRLRYSR